jgi:hypothetical protein
MNGLKVGKNGLLNQVINISKKSGKHKIRKREPDLFEAYDKEMKELYPESEEEPEEEYEESVKKMKVKKSKGIHKVQKEESLSLFPSPEDLPEEESEEDWLERQRKGYEEQAEDFKKMAESGQKFALGTYNTVNKAVQGAKRVGKKLNLTLQKIKSKFGKHKVPNKPIQVFIEPTEEGDYVVYGQTTRREVPVSKPAQPVKVYTEYPSEAEYVKYEELM